MKAATHIGTCQLCGHVQKLPAGRLAKHGYAVQWNTFVGTCPGSDNLPFEQSTNLIEDAIARAETAAANLADHAEDLEGNLERENVWIREYRPATYQRRQSGYEWRLAHRSELEVEHKVNADGTYEWDVVHYISTQTNRREQLEPVRSYTTRGTLAAIVASNNRNYAVWLRSLAKRQLEYAQWLRGRIAGWQPTELQEVK